MNTPLIIIRSLLFNVCFFGWSMLSAFLFIPLFVISSKTAQYAGPLWAWPSLWLAKICCGITYEIRGKEHIAPMPCIYASKHQSAWDTLIFLALLRHPAYVLKRELLRIPFWGWYLWRMKMIAIDRSAKASSIKHMLKQSKAALADNRSIVIYPEGTRTKPGATPVYHPGVVALYTMLKVPVVPVALNSGMFWSKNAFLKRPGKIILEFLPLLPAGMDKEQFQQTLQTAIETASQRLMKEKQ
jgi:1-acyl-sn-glycerol-3-phosphate acyltransferase